MVLPVLDNGPDSLNVEVVVTGTVQVPPKVQGVLLIVMLLFWSSAFVTGRVGMEEGAG